MPSLNENFIRDLQQNVTNSLTKVARSYYGVGMELFHKHNSQTWGEFQPALGNLCIAIELILKAIISNKAISCLFPKAPLEVRLFLTSPGQIPSDGVSPRIYAQEITSFAYETINLNEAISYFYQFFPNEKQTLKPYFSLLSKVRNASVHGALPNFQKFNLNRIAFLAYELFEFLQREKVFNYFFVFHHNKTLPFVESYKGDRVQRVAQEIKKAQEKSKKLEHLGTSMSIDEWDLYVVNCPVCDSDAILDGYTEYGIDEGQGYLFFYADAFECEECGLKLLDSDELNLAGMEVNYDREADLPRWEREHYDGA